MLRPKIKAELTCRKLSARKSSIHGYGVFAEVELKPGDIIEECHILLNQIPLPELGDFYFSMDTGSAILLGYGCLYNHSDRPNASYSYDEEHGLYVFAATAPIKKDEEIFISYGSDWFSSRELKPAQASLRFKLRKLLHRNGYVMRFLTILIALMGLIALIRNHA